MRIYRQPERYWGFVRSHARGVKRLEVEGKGYANQCSAVGTVFGRSLGLQVVRSRPCVLWRGGHRVEWSVCVPSG